MKRWLATKLCPDMARDAEKYHRLLGQVAEARWWLSEFPNVSDVCEWLMESSYNHWRKLGAPSVSHFPAGISEFRDLLRHRIDQQLSEDGK